jgi:hypothetical protein
MRRKSRCNGQRMVTFLVYLNDDYDGGQTEFPRLKVSHSGKAGDGFYFVNALPDGTADTRTLHAGRTPLTGRESGSSRSSYATARWCREAARIRLSRPARSPEIPADITRPPAAAVGFSRSLSPHEERLASMRADQPFNASGERAVGLMRPCR